MMQRDLAFEITKALEAGFNRYLNQSIIYSPFRLFYNLFKKSNPQLLNQGRERIKNDVEQQILNIEDFNLLTFINEDDAISPQGKELLQYCFNIGYFLLKRKLTLRLAFKALRDHALRDEIYNYLLNEINRIVTNLNGKYLTNSAAK